jgi:hypothetical protein
MLWMFINVSLLNSQWHESREKFAMRSNRKRLAECFLHDSVELFFRKTPVKS